MSWLFGSRKKSSPQLVITTSEINDGFVSVETSHRPYESVLPPYPIIPDQMPSTPYQMPSTPYNIIPQPSYQRQFTSNEIKDKGPANPLESIPFKLSSGLSSDSFFSKSDIASIKNQMDSFKYKLNSNQFDYDFKLERSFVQEINSS